jgi:hypothetical protein
MPTIFEDNFNSYNDGDLNGQGGWSKLQGTGTINVQGTIVKEGAKAVSTANTTNAEYIKDGASPVPDGRIVVYVYPKATNGQEFYFYLKTTAGTNVIATYFANNGKVKYYSGDWVEYGPYIANAWNCWEIEWRSSDGKARYRLNGGAWTNWVPRLSTAYPQRVWVQGWYSGENIFDYIAEYPYVPPAGRSYGYIF